MNQLQVHAFSLPKPRPLYLHRSTSTYEFTHSSRRRRRFATIAAAASSTPLLHLPLLPFPKEQVCLRFRIGSPLYCVFYSCRSKTVNMDAELKRPVCPKCSKPTRVCLCARFKTPCVENSVAVTILQHTLEKKHPLNSARIASLGIRNVSVVSVSDVNSQARFAVRSLGSDEEVGSGCLGEESRDCGAFGISKRKWDSFGGSSSCSGLVESSDFAEFADCAEEKREFLVNLDEVFSGSAESDCATFVEGPVMNPIGAVSGPSEDDVVGFTVEKYGAVSSITNRGMPKDQSVLAANCSGKGFSVSKFQRKQLDGNAGDEEFEEFELKIPPGSVLLYPSENSVGIEAIDIKVTNVIVLDATWAKARRMYSENPWLKRLPHLRLDIADVSLYGEVRQQPKAGCLSTIESIVYALKALGEDSDKLDGLLEVFKSMVGDQRRCKDERLSQVSTKPPNS